MRLPPSYAGRRCGGCLVRLPLKVQIYSMRLQYNLDRGVGWLHALFFLELVKYFASCELPLLQYLCSKCDEPRQPYGNSHDLKDVEEQTTSHH
ncbi:hypothetical protein Pcinc_007093 [Petrolisthes cinctipes]|uniref:Uncharacterized protein n=1 Tax=Petrolisthes cinctipes TaxID=88211 RepID=A0AAE1KXQ9_PETCI|nr:hypothetical protein Pcinc_007093 [Petrolisthes cinctipes]